MAEEERKPPTAREVATLLRNVGAVLVGVASVVQGSRALLDAVKERRRHRGRSDHRPLRRRRIRRKKEMKTITLYRPVGQKEHDLIAESGFTAFPPRLPEQPIFYPVLNEPYAAQIARDWNTRDAFSGYVGYVLRFAVRADFLSHYEVKVVGAGEHQEYWIPAADLPAFNAAIVGRIEVVATFRGEQAL